MEVSFPQYLLLHITKHAKLNTILPDEMIFKNCIDIFIAEEKYTNN